MKLPKNMAKMSDVAFEIIQCVRHNQAEYAELPSVDVSKARSEEQEDSLIRWHLRRWFKGVTRDDTLMLLYEITHSQMNTNKLYRNQKEQIDELKNHVAALKEEVQHVRDQATEFQTEWNQAITMRRTAESENDILQQQLAIANHRLHTLLDRFLKATDTDKP